MNVEHTHNIGKLMLAFVCFWTYIAFSQLMLIWIAGLPEETPFYITRFNPGWRCVGILLIVGHFFMPFGALLSRSLKRNPKQLACVAGWILFIHFVDIYWLVMPSRDPRGLRVPLDRRHGLPGRRPGRDRLRRLAPARQASRAGQGPLPRRLDSVQAAIEQPRHTHDEPRPRTRVRGRRSTSTR